MPLPSSFTSACTLIGGCAPAVVKPPDGSVIDTLLISGGVVSFSVPAGAMHFPAAAVPKFVWTSPLMAGVPLPPAKRGVLAVVSDLVYSSAWAHLPPVTGPAHWVRISVPNKTCAIELLTTRTEWTPSTEAWAALKDTKGATLSMDGFSAYLQDNRSSEGAYHLSTPVPFSVGP